MNKEILDELEFEKNKREILKLTKLNKENKDNIQSITLDNDHKFAWEYELENYRKEKFRNRFYMFGSICGVLSLILTIAINWEQINAFLMKL